MKVESSVNACPENFTEQVAGVNEGVGVNTVLEYQAIDDDADSRSSKISANKVRDGAGHAAMGGRVFGMVWGNAEGRPVQERRQFRVAAAGGNGSYWAPEAVLILRIETADDGVGVTRPKNGHEANGVGYAELVVLGEIGKRTRVLLRGVFRPEKTDLCLARRANGAIGVSQNASLFVVVLPLFTVQLSRTVGQELGSARQRERTHLAYPGSRRRQERWWRRLPYARTMAGNVRNVRG